MCSVVLDMASKRSACDSASSSKASKKTKLYCHFKSSWKAQEFSVPVGDRSGAQRTVSGDILSGVDGGDNAKCKLCGITFSVRHGGANDVVKHFSTKKHLEAMSSSSSTKTLDKFGFGQSEVAKRARQRQEEEELQFLKAEALFVQFVAEHNLPFRTGDHFTKLVKQMFPDSNIAKRFHCSRTKTSVLVRYGNGSFSHDQVVERLTTTPIFFSLLVDESNDRGVEAKDLVVLLRFFDPSAMKAVTRFIDLPTSNDGSAAAIFAKMDECLVSRGLTYDHLVSFNSDTCSTMKGVRNGVVRHLKDKQPNLVDFGCICHLENLALKAAMKSLPIAIDSFLVSIHTHFYLSIKRKEQFKEFCEFVDVSYKQILKHMWRQGG